MPYQVGSLCYPTLKDAGGAACASFPVTATLTGNTYTLVSCSSASATDGSLTMTRYVSDVTNSTSQPIATSFVTNQAYGNCLQTDYVESFQSMLGPVLALAVACWGAWKIISYLMFNPRNAE